MTFPRFNLPYTIRREIARGGMGIVYEAEDQRLGRTVALKVVNPGEFFSGDRLSDIRARLRDEARIAARLSHPNLVTIHAFESEGELDVIAMEYLDGMSLDSAIRSGMRWNWREALQFLSQVAAGVATAHDAGIVHRDLKPANLFILRDGRVKVLDFGLATAPDLPEPTSEDRVVLGSIHYMAPEQISGGEVGSWTDVFALGSIAYEMVTGHRAFGEGSAAAVGFRITSQRPPLLVAQDAETWFGPLLPILKDALAQEATARITDGSALERRLAAASTRAPRGAVGPRIRRSGAEAWRQLRRKLGIRESNASESWVARTVSREGGRRRQMRRAAPILAVLVLLCVFLGGAVVFVVLQTGSPVASLGASGAGGGGGANTREFRQGAAISGARNPAPNPASARVLENAPPAAFAPPPARDPDGFLLSSNVSARVFLRPMDQSSPVQPRDLGSTPLQVELPPGGYRFTFVVPYQSEREVADALTRGDGERLIHLDFPTSGNLMVETDGRSGFVSVSGGEEMPAPWVFQDLPLGPVEVRVRMPGNPTVIDTVFLRPEGVRYRVPMNGGAGP